MANDVAPEGPLERESMERFATIKFQLAHACGRGLPCPACALQQAESELTALREGLAQLRLAVDELIRATASLVNRSLGFDEYKQEWFCLRCSPDKDGPLHERDCPVYRAHDAFEKVEALLHPQGADPQESGDGA